MKRVFGCCFTIKDSKASPHEINSKRSEETMEKPSTSSANDDLQIEKTAEKLNSGGIDVSNILLNHDFSGGLHLWNPNSCDAFVVTTESSYPDGTRPAKVGYFPYAVVTNRKECWHGLEQDITSRVTPGSTYIVSAQVGVSGTSQGSIDVQATLKLEFQNSETTYLSIGRKLVQEDCWEKLEGTFLLTSMPYRVIFYLEGPSPRVNLLIKSATVSCTNSRESDTPPGLEKRMEENIILNPRNGSIGFHYESSVGESNSCSNYGNNIILNHDFSGGMHLWHPNGCDAFVVTSESSHPDGVQELCYIPYAVVTNRKENWQGLEQDITSRVTIGSTYTVSAKVGVSGTFHDSSDVQATLKLEYQNSNPSYLLIGRKTVSKNCWEILEGTFSLSILPSRVVFYLEGPSSGVDLLIKSVVVSCTNFPEFDKWCPILDTSNDENIILNPRFEDGLQNWSGRGCKIALNDSMADGKILPMFGTKVFASTTERTQSWNGIQQEITGRMQRKLVYEVTAMVRIFGNNVSNADVRATLWVQALDHREQYIGIGKIQATNNDWVQLQGKVLLNGSPAKVVIYLEGPPPGTDILLNSLIVKHASKAPPSQPPVIEDEAYGINIISNSNLSDGTKGWFPLGNCALTVKTGSPHIIPPMARDSLGVHEPLSGHFIHVSSRTQTWMGPAQMISEKVKLYMTYQVSAWVRIGPGATSPQNVNIALGVDNQWVNGGQVEVSDDRWHEIGGSFRIERQPSKVMVYVQGPAAGIDLMVGGLQIFPVDRHLRVKHLKRQADKIRKRDVILKFSGLSTDSLLGTFVKVKQTKNSFPIGSCVSRTNIDNEDFVDFFAKHFNWAVFGNELKWYWTEPQEGNFNYKDADELLDLCTKYNIQVRGHCIFWEVVDTVQQWIRALSKDDLEKAVQNRLTGLLSRYKGKFKHYDVNNEMMHGSFYQDKLGKDIRASMFKTANELEPSALLFVNDYHVEDGCDSRSSPEKYVDHIVALQEQGAPVGGIGIQGHIDSPVGPIVCSALDKLGILGLPIWFTELDVSSENEYVRADDLEVMLREAFAHPAVEGIMLWGFWELFMSRENSHLVDAEGDINEAGKKYLALKQEWLSHAHGHADDQGQFCFRGFHGSYEVEIADTSHKVTTTFAVDNGEGPLLISIQL